MPPPPKKKNPNFYQVGIVLETYNWVQKQAITIFTYAKADPKKKFMHTQHVIKQMLCWKIFEIKTKIIKFKFLYFGPEVAYP